MAWKLAYAWQKHKAQLTELDEKGGNNVSLADLRFEDTQEIQVLQDKCQQLAHLSQMSQMILQSMSSRFEVLCSINSLPDDGEPSFTLKLLAEADHQMCKIDNILKRLDGTIALVSKLDYLAMAPSKPFA